MGLLGNIKKIRGLKSEILTLIRAYIDARTPVKTKLLVAILSLTYIVSPIDILPNILPLLGLTDDMVVLPLIMWTFLPQNVLNDARRYIQNKQEKQSQKRHWFWWALVILLVIGILFLLWKYLGFDLTGEAPIIPSNSL